MSAQGRPGIVTVGLIILLAGLTTPAPAGENEWTLLFHMCGDSHNESIAIDDINALERGFDPAGGYSVLVQLDRIAGYDASNGDWTTCRRYLLQPDPGTDRTIRSTLIQDIGEVNVGDPQTIADFLTWGMQNYPAKRYAVVLWGGAMANGFGADASSGDDAIRTLYGELTDALAATTAAVGRRIDFGVVWGCNYGMFENDYVIREYVDVTARSQLATWNAEGSATDILQWLNANPTASARQFATAWVDAYMDYATSKGRCAGWAALDLGPGHVRLGLAVDTFARELIKAGGKDQPDIAAAMAGTVYVGGIDFDMCHFAKNIADAPGLPQALRDAAGAVVDAYGYPPQQPGKPLLNFRFVEGLRASNESWPTGDTAELRGSKIRKITYSTGPAVDPPDVAGKPRYESFVANNAWHWFVDGQSSLPDELLLTYDSGSLGDVVAADGAPLSFSLTLRNSGGADASGILGVLSTTDPYVTITQGTSAFPDIASEATAAGQADFTVTIDPAAPDGHRIWFSLDVTADGGAYANTTTFCCDVPEPGALALLALAGPWLLAFSPRGRRRRPRTRAA